MLKRERENIDAALKVTMETADNLRNVYGEETLVVLRDPRVSIAAKKEALLRRTKILLMANPPRNK